jgi:hypothetical protein
VAKAVFFRVTDDLHAAVATIAKSQDRSIGYLFIKAMEQWLANPAPVQTPPPRAQPDTPQAPPPPKAEEWFIRILDHELSIYGLIDGQKRVMPLETFRAAYFASKEKTSTHGAIKASYNSWLHKLVDRGRIGRTKTMIWRL